MYFFKVINIVNPNKLSALSDSFNNLLTTQNLIANIK